MISASGEFNYRTPLSSPWEQPKLVCSPPVTENVLFFSFLMKEKKMSKENRPFPVKAFIKTEQ